ncbi:conjugal transfer protein [Streptomyces sp. T-3]|nr:conjugal transfer protein [Streptomyces sp. T-3]
MCSARRAQGGEAAAPTAAGVVLQDMYRRVRLGRVGVWGALAAGPVALAMAVLAPSPTVSAAAPKASKAGPAARVADPSGYAEVFLAAWLRSSSDATGSAQARVAQSLGPSVALPDPVDGAEAAQRVSAVRSAHWTEGRWSVTVAAQYPDGTVRYFAVPVVAGKDGGSFAIEEAPGRVAGPARAEVPESIYRVSVPTEGELASTVGGFLTAYLARDGEVERYLAPGVRLSAVASARYQGVEVESAAADSDQATGEAVPGDGTRVRVRVQVIAEDAAGSWPLAYELTMSARAGRWEVAALDSGTAAASKAGGERS